MSSAGVALSPLPEDPTLSHIRGEGARSPHCTAESILIYLSFPSASAVLPMRVLDSESISSVKLRIQSCRGFVVKKQKLIFDGRELARNECLIRDYGVGNGNILHLALRLSDLRVIVVKTTLGREYEFQVEQSKNIGYIKEQIVRKKEIGFAHPREQKLLCNGEELDDRCLIEDICRERDAVVHLLVCKSSKIRSKPVERDLELSIETPEEAARPPLEPFVVNPEIEVPPAIREMIEAAVKGLEKGKAPVRSTEGSGGAYFMRGASGWKKKKKYVAVFKPIDEEPMAVNNPQGLPLSVDGQGLKRGTRVGEGALREVAAYILDRPMGSGGRGFAGVPPTTMARCTSEAFHHPAGFATKIGSLQMFVENIGTCEDMGPRAFPLDDIHRIAVLDIRLANADRHAGNILICKPGKEQDEGEGFRLVPIDHGYCLPENFEDCTFEWLYWPQAREAFRAEAVEYIKSLDAEEDIALLRFHGWELSIECARVLRISTMLLKKGAEKGLSPFAIGSLMCRETIKKESAIEEIVREATDAVLPLSSEEAFMECVSEAIDRRLDSLPFTAV